MTHTTYKCHVNDLPDPKTWTLPKATPHQVCNVADRSLPPATSRPHEGLGYVKGKPLHPAHTLIMTRENPSQRRYLATTSSKLTNRGGGRKVARGVNENMPQPLKLE